MKTFTVDSQIVYRSRDGSIPQARRRQLGANQWMSLNSDPHDIPLEAFELRDVLDYPNDRGYMGQQLNIEWSTQPDWYRREHHWRPFIPKSVSFENQWVLPLTLKVEGIENYEDAYRFLPIFRSSVVERIRLIERATEAVCDYIEYPLDGPRPEGHLIAEELLSRNWDSEASVETAFVSVRRILLDQLGLLSWQAAYQPDYAEKEGFPSIAVEIMNSYGVREVAKVGVIIDLTRDWREVNIDLYTTNDVPVFYLWTDVEQENPRFQRLSPSFLHAQSEGGLPAETPLSFQSTELAMDSATSESIHHEHPLAYDKFLQLSIVGPYHGLKAMRGTLFANFVVFFQGWKRRPVNDDALISTYLAKYASQVLSSPMGNVRVFHRYRPLERSIADSRYYLETSHADAEELSTHQIREQFKALCAPLPHQSFNQAGLPAIINENPSDLVDRITTDTDNPSFAFNTVDPDETMKSASIGDNDNINSFPVENPLLECLSSPDPSMDSRSRYRTLVPEANRRSSSNSAHSRRESLRHLSQSREGVCYDPRYQTSSLRSRIEAPNQPRGYNLAMIPVGADSRYLRSPSRDSDRLIRRPFSPHSKDRATSLYDDFVRSM